MVLTCIPCAPARFLCSQIPLAHPGELSHLKCVARGHTLRKWEFAQHFAGLTWNLRPLVRPAFSHLIAESPFAVRNYFCCWLRLLFLERTHFSCSLRRTRFSAWETPSQDKTLERAKPLKKCDASGEKLKFWCDPEQREFFLLLLFHCMVSPTIIHYLHRELVWIKRPSSSLFDLALRRRLPKSCLSDYPLGGLVSSSKRRVRQDDGAL